VTDIDHYTPEPAYGARVKKNEVDGKNDKWTLILVRDLRHAPEKVWQALTDPAHLREWAPFVVDQSLGTMGTVNISWVGRPQQPLATKVTRADAPRLLECGDMRWELEPLSSGTRLTLFHKIDRGFIAWGAASWHVSFDALDRLLAGKQMGGIAGVDAMKFAGWQRLVAEYSEQFGIKPPNWPPKS
jgi:uncharacterized protein YndB with AHSA1/START domain